MTECVCEEDWGERICMLWHVIVSQLPWVTLLCMTTIMCICAWCVCVWREVVYTWVYARCEDHQNGLTGVYVHVYIQNGSDDVNIHFTCTLPAMYVYGIYRHALCPQRTCTGFIVTHSARNVRVRDLSSRTLPATYVYGIYRHALCPQRTCTGFIVTRTLPATYVYGIYNHVQSNWNASLRFKIV